MNNEKLRADIKRELNRPTSMKKLAELLTRCYVALGELDTSMLPAEAQAGLALQRNEIDRLKQQLRAEGDRIAELNAKLGEQQSVPVKITDQMNQAGAAYQREQVKGLVEALEQITDTDPDDGTAWFHDVANKALATYKAAQEGK